MLDKGALNQYRISAMAIGLLWTLTRAGLAAAPAAPGALQARSPNANTIMLTWTDNAVNETGYAIERSRYWEGYQTIASVAPNTASYTDTGLSPDTLYLYRVRALGSTTNSSYSNWHFAATLRTVNAYQGPVCEATWLSGNQILVSWKEHFAEAGFEVLRSLNSAPYAAVGSVGPNVTSFVDQNGIDYDQTYTYAVRALGSGTSSALGEAPCYLHWNWSWNYAGCRGAGNKLTKAVTPPANVRVEARSSSAACIRWDDRSDNETGFMVMYSWNGTHFRVLKGLQSSNPTELIVGANVTECVHHGLIAEVPIFYRVVALSADGTFSAPSDIVETRLGFDDSLQAPTGLTARVLADQSVFLEWVDNSTSESGFAIEALADPYSEFVTYPAPSIVGANVTSCTITSVEASTWQFRVQALGVNGGSRYSNTVDPDWSPTVYLATPFASSETPNPRTVALFAAGAPVNAPVTVSTKSYGSYSELLVLGTAGNDRIEVHQVNGAIVVTANGLPPQTIPGSFGALVVKGLEGNDTIIVHPDVSVRTLLYGGPGNDALNAFSSGRNTIVTVGYGTDLAVGNGINTSYWTDQTGVDTVYASVAEIKAGRVHRIASFFRNVSKDPDGQDLSEAGMGVYDTGPYVRFPNCSLWGTGASPFDVNQGFFQDCYDTGRWQCMPLYQPDRLEECAVDLGDGTYAVQYGQPSNQTYARVDGDLKDGPLGYSCIGPQYNLWWMVIEKVMVGYAPYGLHQPTPTWTHCFANNMDPSTIYESLRKFLEDGRIVEVGTSGRQLLDTPTVDHGHNYGLLQVYRDAIGNPRFILRNPYGKHYQYGAPPDDPLHGLVDLGIVEFLANFSAPRAIDYRFGTPTSNILFRHPSNGDVVQWLMK